MSGEAEFQVRVESAITAVPRDEWDSCASGLPADVDSKSQAASECTLPRSALESNSETLESTLEGTFEDPDNPFIRHDFLDCLERSGSVGRGTGWVPQHLVVEQPGAPPVAVAPCYLKGHSQGEYVFDHGWADAYERAGGSYYPKLQVAVPFTPVTGRRLLARPGPGADAARSALLSAFVQLARKRQASSVHVTFADETDGRFMTEAGFLARNDRQFHWHNRGYGSFEEFLAALSSNKRKTIRKERKAARESGLEIIHLTGSDLTEAVWDDFFGFYMDTGSRKWGRPYLTRAFFSLIGERMAGRILLVAARRQGRLVAGALNFLGQHTVYGRNWGAIEHHPFLHFELCYYQAIEYAIERGFRSVEAGAQGEHKLLRGYVPVETRSAHFIADPALRKAVADYLKRERRHVAEEHEALAAAAPYRRDFEPQA